MENKTDSPFLDGTLSLMENRTISECASSGHLISGVITATGTCILLCLIKTAIHMLMKNDVQCIRLNHTRTCQMNNLQNQPTGRCICLTADRLPWYYSNLAVDVLLYPVITCIGLYIVHGTSMTDQPFAGGSHGNLFYYSMCVVIGNLFYRLILVISGPQTGCHFKISYIHIPVAIVMYISIWVTMENHILGVIGMVTQFPVLLKTLRRLALHSESRRDKLSCTLLTVTVARVGSIIIFSMILPIIYLSMAFTVQSVTEMSFYSVAVFSFCVAFVAVVTIVETIQTISYGCTDVLTVNETRLLLGENTNNTPGSYGNIGHTCKNKPSLSYPFTNTAILGNDKKYTKVAFNF